MTLTLFSRSLHYKNSKNEPCVHSISWLNRWNLTKLAQILQWDGGKKWLDFSDLDLIFKVTLALCRGYLISIAYWQFFSFLQLMQVCVKQCIFTFPSLKRQTNISLKWRSLVLICIENSISQPSYFGDINISFICKQYAELKTGIKETSVNIWATSWGNLFLPYANNKGTDQHAHPRSLINAFIIRCLDSIIPLVSISKISSLYIASVAAQAGLSLSWSQTPKDRFSRNKAHLYKQRMSTWPNYLCSPIQIRMSLV